ncbi:MAG TPA: BlaI/MecI/CopY family transcriptional regulator [Candidatus Acidoferrales bacterium]|nr:BlaI/MecI/CopY family transcriptional regulator [Candidatus Acidoferrales bacterium]
MLRVYAYERTLANIFGLNDQRFMLPSCLLGWSAATDKAGFHRHLLDVQSTERKPEWARSYANERMTSHMAHFFRDRMLERGDSPQPANLGPLEEGVMDVLWTRGESSVRDVAQKIERPLAYTTVMTTLDRLFKKRLLDRRKEARAFLYSPRLTRTEWERTRANDLVAGFLAGSERSRDLLLSCFLDAMGEHDEALLAELEKKIRTQRRKLVRRAQTS